MVAPACSSNSGDAKRPPTWEVDPDPIVAIGTLEGDEAYVFSRIAAVRILPTGGLAVADGSSGTIRLFGSEGRLRRAVGRIGEGPGEFQYINGMWFHPPDTLLVYDADAFRLTTYLTSGERISTRAFRADQGRPESYLGRVGTDAVLVWIKQRMRNESVISPDTMQIGRFGPDGLLSELLVTGLGMRRLGGPVPFSPHFLRVMVDETIFHTDGLSGSVSRTSARGQQSDAIEIPITRLNPDLAWSQLQSAVDSARAEQLREARSTPGADTIPVFSDLLADDSAYLWLKLYAPETDSHWVGRSRTGGDWVVLTGDGLVVAQVAMPDLFRPMDIRGDLVAGVGVDALGIERAMIYRVRRN